ncbi:MAG TPA: hypothetical protein VGQ18_05975 [Gemmatimonadales bacterium]|nr:hypothetical protein [Gemmatimonadales bacterium]
MKTLTVMCLILLPTACSGQSSGRVSSNDREDPCTLVSRAEAEQILGPMRHDPYRVAGPNREPAPNGSYCFYETRKGRRVVMNVEWKDGVMEMKVLGMMGRLVEQAIPTDTGQADTLEGRWDELRMLPGDNLYARKGDQLVSIDYNGSGIGLIGAARWVHIALGHFGHPLAYDGAAAGRSAPGPLVPPGDPCGLIPRADFERIAGTLSGDPVVGPHQDKCTYTLAQSRGLAGNKIELQVQWRDGWAALENSRATTNTVVGKVAPPGSMAQGNSNTGVSTGSPGAAGADSQLGGFMNKLMGVARSQGIGVQTTATGGLASDTAVAGPWDSGALVMGLGFYAVKHDAMLSLDLRGIDYDQAKALIAKAMERIP